MTQLSTTQIQVLQSAAAERRKGTQPDPRVGSAVRALLRRGFLIPASGEDRRVLITPKGRDALKPHVKPPAAQLAPAGKVATLISLLSADDGVSLPTLMEATGWQAHSVRGAIAGSVKRKFGHAVLSEQRHGVRIYKIVGADQ